jgi:beta-lactam-binding protein with PASTA domain
VQDSAEKALKRITGAKPSRVGCTVPFVIGKTSSDARALWTQAGFKSMVETVGTDEYRARSQVPSPGEVIDCDTMIPLLLLP